MLRWKFAGIRIAGDCIVAFLIYKLYFVGANIGVLLTGWDNWCIRVVFGSYIAACMYWLLSKAKGSIFFLFKCGTIWSVCNRDDNTTVLGTLKNITCDWKETFSIPAIDYAIRGIFKQVGNKIGVETPEVLKPLESSSIYQTSKRLAKYTYSYADECTLAWSYKNDDTLLSECITGICLFIKHSGELMVYITPIILLRTFVRVAMSILLGVLYVWHMPINVVTLIGLIVFLNLCDFVLDDAILEPFLMDSVVRKFLEYTEKDSDVSQIKDTVENLLDFGDLKAKLRRFSDNGEDKADTGAVEDSEE